MDEWMKGHICYPTRFLAVGKGRVVINTWACRYGNCILTWDSIRREERDKKSQTPGHDR